MTKNIPQSRLILYIMIIGLLPIVLVTANILSKKNQLNNLQNTLAQVEQLAMIHQKKQSLNTAVQKHYANADHFYIDKHLEALSFLTPERESLQMLVNNKNFAGDENVKRRLDFLSGSENTMLFSEGNIQNYPYFQETTAALVHPVEVNLKDLKQILSIVEGIPIGPFKPGPDRPQLIILDLKIDKKEVTENNHIFLLNMKLLKREYLS